MTGEINIGEFMDEEQRLKSWQAKRNRDLEYVVLKDWRRLGYQIRNARCGAERDRAIAGRKQLAERYLPELQRILPKWERAQQAKQHRRRVRKGQS